MDKRYQVFISSTFVDLQEERQEVMQALLELDCIPSGMELFPAANDDQWSLIKKVIDDCDYYMVIIGGRYGSIGSKGFSYTEMEYRYALEKGKPIIGFLHKNPQDLPAKKTEEEKEGREKLEKFRNFAQQKLVKYWTTPSDLGSVVSRSLIRLIKNYPAIGWVRADNVPEEGATKEILKLRKEIEVLENKLKEARTSAPKDAENLSQGDDLFEIKYSFYAGGHSYSKSTDIEYTHTCETTWNELFYILSPLMIDETDDVKLINCINEFIKNKKIEELYENDEMKHLYLRKFKIDNADFQTIKVQLRALGLITKSKKNRSVKDTKTYWSLTPYGDDVMTRLRAIKRNFNK